VRIKREDLIKELSDKTKFGWLFDPEQIRKIVHQNPATEFIDED